MRSDVRAVLDRSKAFRALPEDQRHALAHDLARVVAFLEDPTLEEQVQGSPEIADLVRDVDFPSFVSGLIEGVFTSIVNASIRQMEAYTEAMKAVTSSLDDFQAEGAHPDRRQQLATMVLLGIHRLVVTDGRIKGKVHFDLKSRDSDDESDDGRQ